MQFRRALRRDRQPARAPVQPVRGRGRRGRGHRAAHPRRGLPPGVGRRPRQRADARGPPRPDERDLRGWDRPVLLSLRSARRVLGRAGHRSRGRDRVAPAGAADLRRAPARPAAGRARPDDRLDGAADHRRRARRARPSVLGRHGVPADRDGFGAALRQARRPLRAQDRPPGRDRDLPRRLGALRPRRRAWGS